MALRHRKGIVSGILIAALLFSLLLGCLPLSASAAGTGYRLTEETTKSGNNTTKITYSYDKSGKLSLKMEYYNGRYENCTAYRYYPNGKLYEELWSGSCDLYMHYDSNGTLIERDDTGGVGSPANLMPSAGDKLSVTVDSSKRITRFDVKRSYGGSSTLRYEYDNKGRILRFYDGDGSRQDVYSYNSDGSFTRTRTDRYNNSITLSISEFFDSSGRVIQRDWQSGGYFQKTCFEYDSKGNLTRQYDPSGSSDWVFKYDKYGNLTGEWYNGKQSCSYTNTYDKNGCLTKSVRKAGNSTQTTTYVYERA